MAIMELTSARGMGSQECSSRVLDQLGLGRTSRASAAAVNEFLRRALNDRCGQRMVDAFDAYEGVRRGLGSSLSWILGYDVGTPVRSRIANTVNDELYAFVRGREESGVRVMAYRMRDNRVVLEHVETPKDPLSGIPRRCALLVPAGVTSPRIKDGAVYVRLDVQRSRTGRSLFDARAFAFTDADGRALAGFGAVTACIENLDDVPAALREALGSVYDEIAVNAGIYDAWWNHLISNREGGRICVDLGFSEEGDAVCLAMDLVQTGVWRVAIVIGGEPYSPEELAASQVIVLDPDDVLEERHRLVDAYRTCRPDDPMFAYNHIFHERRARFPSRFRQLLEIDEDRAVSLFMDELQRRFAELHANPGSWLTTMFHGGAEHELSMSGDRVSTCIQLLVPLFLDDEDREIGRPSVYLVASSNVDSMGREYLAFPTILDGRIVQRNRNALRRALRKSA